MFNSFIFLLIIEKMDFLIIYISNKKKSNILSLKIFLNVGKEKQYKLLYFRFLK